MSALAWINVALFMGLLLLAAWPLSRWITAIARGALPRWMLATERGLMRLFGVDGAEVRCEYAAHADGAKAARQAYPGLKPPKPVAKFQRACIGAEEAGKIKDGAHAAAQVFLAFKA